MEDIRLSLDEKRTLQLSELEILMELKKLCENNGLRYYLTAGTLLGAVRHKGFIPWDDDIDIVMPRKDYDRLAYIGKLALPGDLYFQDSNTEINFPYFFGKIRKHNTSVYEPCLKDVDIGKGHYIDIFPLDICPKNDRTAYLYFKLIGLLSSAYQGRVDKSFICGYTKKYMRVLYFILVRFPLTWLRGMRYGLVSLFPCGKSNRLCTVGGAHGYPAETYGKSWFEKSEQMEFEGEMFPVPIGWHELLSNMYGDYLTPPDDTERAGHFEKR